MIKDCKGLSRGVTIIELLVAMALLAFLTLVAGQLLILGNRSGVTASRQESAFRDAALGFDFLGRELRLSDGIINPPLYTWPVGNAYSPKKGSSPPFIFLRHGAASEGTVVVAYEWDQQSGTLERFLYPESFRFYIANTPEIL